MQLQRYGLLLGYFLLAWPISLFAADSQLEAGLVNPGYEEKPDWFKHSFLDLREDVEEARQNGKRVLLYFYQDGCPYCKKLLQDNFGQRALADKTRKHFDVIAVNMWGDREVTDVQGKTLSEKNFAASQRVMFTPTMVFLNEKGKVAYRINGYYFPQKFEAALDFVSGKHETRTSFAEYFAKQAPAASKGKLHEQAFFMKSPHDIGKALKTGGKPVMVIFEQKHCRACDELHGDIFKRRETLAEVDKLSVIRLDMWSDTPLTTPDGQKTTARAWAKKLNINYAPSFVFFDGKTAKEVFRTDAYLKAFHMQSVMDYVSSGAYRQQPSFQRYISARAEKLEQQGVHIDLWN